MNKRELKALKAALKRVGKEVALYKDFSHSTCFEGFLEDLKLIIFETRVLLKDYCSTK